VIYDFFVIMMSTDSLLEQFQAFMGVWMYSYFAQMMNFVTQLYTLYKLDDFRWGKTRIGVTAKVE
jgi:chitin synthase